MALNEIALKPDIIFFMNVSAEVCMERMEKRNQPEELFESNLAATRNKFLSAIDFLKKTRNEKVVEIDGNGTIEQSVTQMLGALEKLHS